MSEENKFQNSDEGNDIPDINQPILEEDVTIYDEALSIDRSRQKSRRVFVFYIIGLFCVALVLILVSYVMQQHANRQLEDLGSQLTEQTDAATGAKARADQLQATIDAMQEQLDESKATTDMLNQTVEEQKKSLDAMNNLWQLERAYQRDDSETALEIIEQMDSAYTRDVLIDEQKEPLTGDAAQEYADICSELGV